MVCHTQNYWGFGHFPSSGVLGTKKTRRFRNWISFRPQVWGKTPTHLGPLDRANLNHCIQLSRYLPPTPEEGNRSIFETSCFLVLKIPGDGKCPKRQ
jgi:hypothetical protein